MAQLIQCITPMGVGLSGAEEIANQLPEGANVITPMRGSNGHRTFH
jgi:hypothetical protein